MFLELVTDGTTSATSKFFLVTLSEMLQPACPVSLLGNHRVSSDFLRENIFLPPYTANPGMNCTWTFTSYQFPNVMVVFADLPLQDALTFYDGLPGEHANPVVLATLRQVNISSVVIVYAISSSMHAVFTTGPNLEGSGGGLMISGSKIGSKVLLVQGLVLASLCPGPALQCAFHLLSVNRFERPGQGTVHILPHLDTVCSHRNSRRVRSADRAAHARAGVYDSHQSKHDRSSCASDHN
jgi:hypothetical protein